MLAALVGLLGDFDLAEEATAEAFAIAAETWPRRAAPQPPRLAHDDGSQHGDRPVRRDRTHETKTAVAADRQEGTRQWTPLDAATSDSSSSSRAATPPSPIEAQVALTLRTLGGLTTDEIARAFLVPEATMAQRLVRAKRKIKAGRHPVPGPARGSPARAARGGSRRRVPHLQRGLRRARRPRAEALWLGRALADLMPDQPEAHGLLAMMLLHDSRRDARLRDGELVLLADQDRAVWDSTRSIGAAPSSTGLRSRRSGPYVIQATIASLHADDPRDWRHIAVLYGELARMTGSPSSS